VRTRTSQLHPDTENSVRYVFLNTTVAPFSDSRVRQAVNFAVDRRAAAAALGGPLEASVTCQLIPPSLFGYRPYCPYTAKATSAGIWSGPDRARARELIRQAHAVGSKVTVVIPTDHAAVARVIVSAMRSIGLDAKARIFPQSPDGSDTAYFNYIATQTNDVQAALEGWFVDYPEPSNLIGQLLECSDRTPAGNLDESMFCDPTVDLEITSALEEQETDPATAGAAWASIDQTIDNLAPWVPLANDREYDVVSQRVQNYQHNPEYGMLIDQAWLN
jgi:peptide/nickel transport system substrate-binding protein